MLRQMFVSAAVHHPVRDIQMTEDIVFGRLTTAKLLLKESAVSATAVYSNIRILEHTLKKSLQSIEEVLVAVDKPLIAKISDLYTDLEAAATEPIRVIGRKLPLSESATDHADLQEHQRRLANLVRYVKDIIEEFSDTSSAGIGASETSTLITVDEGEGIHTIDNSPIGNAISDLRVHCDIADSGMATIAETQKQMDSLRKGYETLNSYFSSTDIAAANTLVQKIPGTEWAALANIEHIESHLLSSKALPSGDYLVLRFNVVRQPLNHCLLHIISFRMSCRNCNHSHQRRIE